MKNTPDSIQSCTNRLRIEGKPFAVATVVRTVSITAAKAGAKAIIADSEIVAGWIGGGCARAAVMKAASDCISTGQPRLVSIQPEDLLQELGVESGVEHAGTHYASNHCPSQGTMDIFVEPELPAPQLLIIGETPVAAALINLVGSFHFDCQPSSSDDIANQGVAATLGGDQQFIVVATQGSGDFAALSAALHSPAEYVAFVGSRRKTAQLVEKIKQQAASTLILDKLHAPAGIDIGAITPDEIALSILAQIVKKVRRGQREEPFKTAEPANAD